MKSLLQRLETQIASRLQEPLSPLLVNQTKQALKQHHIADIPQDYLNFLRSYNGLHYQDAWLCGIFAKHDCINDILDLNIRISHPLAQDTILLGFDEFDFLGYSQKWNIYQIIDKDDFEVLEEYQDLEQALNYILKMEA